MSTLAQVPTESDAIFDAQQYDLPIPKDRYGRKADKLTVSLGSFEIDRTSENELEVFNVLAKGQPVRLVVEAFVVEASERSKASEDAEETEVRRVLKVLGLEVA